MAEGDSSALQQWLVESVAGMHLEECDSVKCWLEDLRQLTETECMCVLQGKSLTKETSDFVFSATKTVKDSIDTIKGRAVVISAEFAKLFRKLEKERWKHVRSGALRLTCQIRSLLHECNSSVTSASADVTQHDQHLMEECAKLAQYLESVDLNNSRSDDVIRVAMRLMTSVGQAFSELVDDVLSGLIKKLLSLVVDPHHPQGVKASLSNLVSLGLEGEHMCILIAREGGVQSLFVVCRSETFKFAHAQALRAIATLCCVAESIGELEQAGGVEILTNILSNPDVEETVRAEAAGVVAQITSPCLEHYQHLSGFIENLGDLVSSLTVLCAEASCHEVILLASAALANITFMDNMACDYLQQCQTAQVLIEVCALDKADSLFAKDQAATVLGNMAAVDGCMADIMDNNGVEILIHFLYEECPDRAGPAEVAAYERVLQKSAIALTRLSRLAENAHLAVEVGGIPRLVELCREPKERCGSDAVLVACLAALRKICSVCPVEEHMCPPEDASALRELVQPKLMDTFLMCSNLDESAV